MQQANSDKQPDIVFEVATPHGSDKNATLHCTKISEIYQVATPHGSDKNATYSNCAFIPSIRVATPHGSDKNATEGRQWNMKEL